MPGRRSLAWRSPVRSVVTSVTSGGWLGPRVGRLACLSRGVAVALQRALRDPSRHVVVAWKDRPQGSLGCPARDTRALPRPVRAGRWCSDSGATRSGPLHLPRKARPEETRMTDERQRDGTSGAGNAADLPSRDVVVSMRNVSRAFDNRTVVRDINL